MPSIPVKNPANNTVLYEIQEASGAEVRETFENARSAFETVRNLFLAERLHECRKIQYYIVEHREEIVDRIVRENGKSRFDCLSNEIFAVLDVLDYYRKHAAKILSASRSISNIPPSLVSV